LLQKNFKNMIDNNIAIKVDNVSKKFCKRLRYSIAYGLTDISKKILGISIESQKLRKNEFWALDDISFELKKGETLGIIGPNGAGKTTLLKLLSGIIMPDKGKIEVNGRVGALIELGAGFHPLLTGRENIYINGAILGMSKKEIDKKFDSIVDFADIGDFLDMPVKSYSSGMFVRLGFAVAIHSEPDILLIDEVLAVGDMNFRRKCYQRMLDLKKEKKTIVFVSHNLLLIKKLCQKSMLLDQGKMVFYDNTVLTVNNYISLQENRFSKEPLNGYRWGTGEAKIEYVKLSNIDNIVTDTFYNGENICITLGYNASKKIENPIFWICITDDEDNKISGTTTMQENVIIPYIMGKGEIKCIFKNISLCPGIYYIIAGIYGEDGEEPYDRFGRIAKFRIIEKTNQPLNPNFTGIFRPEVKWLTQDK